MIMSLELMVKMSGQLLRGNVVVHFDLCRSATHSRVVHLLKESGPHPALLLCSSPPTPLQLPQAKENYYSEIKAQNVALRDKVWRIECIE